jgi:general secretion pathway protein A
MYNQFFRLRENPFNVNPDPRYLFLTRQTEAALDGLKHGIQARKGLLLLTGEVGTGKTTLLNHLLDWLHDQRSPTAFIFNSHLEISHLFDFVLADFAVKFDARLKDNALMRLHQWLWERYRAGDTPVVIIDEAQGLPDRVLEEIRMLLNLETSSEKLLQIVLAGQPELEERLQQPELRQVKQRIALRCKTAALSLEQAHQYVQARLHIAGADGPRVFAADAMDAVHFYSRGIPRVMNLLCEHALINASAEQLQPVPARFVAEVASEFQFDDSRPVAGVSVLADGPRSGETPAQSRFLNALVSLSATDEPPAPGSAGPLAIAASRWHAPADNVFSPVQEVAAPFSCRETFPDDTADAAACEPFSIAPSFAPGCEQSFAARSAEAVAIISKHAISEQAIAVPADESFAAPCEELNVQATAPAAPWLRQLETRLLADWTSFFSEVGGSLALDSPAEPAAAAHPPRLHLVESKSAVGFSSAANRSYAPSFQNLALPSSEVDAAKSFCAPTVLMKRMPLRLLLAGWTAKSRARFSSTFTAAVGLPGMANLMQLPARCRRPLRTLYWGSLAWADRGLDIATSIDWAQMQSNAQRWLRQPCDPTQWRLPDSRLFEQVFRFHHKDM